jgi:hypothetical protein
LQQDLDADHPELDIELLGINPVGHESHNAAATAGNDIPWLQDVDTNNDGQSDVWLNSWEVEYGDVVIEVEYRDVVIVDQENVPVATFNLTTHDLGNATNYQTLRQMLIDAAMADQEPELQAGDANGDYQFDQRDLLQVFRAGKFDSGEPATWQEGDWNGDNVFDRLDVIAALQAGNYLEGPYAAAAAEVAEHAGRIAVSEHHTADDIDLDGVLT